MIVVSDTTPVTTLLKCGEEHLLQQLFGTVIVPQAVWDELIRFHPRPPAFVSLHQVETPDRRLFGTEHLGRGEAEALKLAMQIQADLLLCDDKQACRAADALKIPVMGLIGVTLMVSHSVPSSSVKSPAQERSLTNSSRRAACT